MPARRRYRPVVVALSALLAAAAGPLAGGGGDGHLLELLIAARAAVVPPGEPPEASTAAVVALDRRSLEAPELAATPRALMAPEWAAVLDALFRAGARAVGFDLIFAYTGNRLHPDFDAPLLEALARHRSRLVLARSDATLPDVAYLGALRANEDRDRLGVTTVEPDPDGVSRRLFRVDARTGEPTLAGALARAAGLPAMPASVLLVPRRHLEALPAYAMVDVLRCAGSDAAGPGAAALAQAFRGKVVLVGGTLPEEDRRVPPGRWLAPPLSDGPALHSCGLRRLAASAPRAATLPGVFLHAGALEALITGRLPRAAGPAAVGALAAVMAAAGSALGLRLAPWLAAAALAVIALGLLTGATATLAGDLWVPLAVPLGALVAAPVAAYVVRYVVEDRARRRILHAFSHYLSPAVVDRLAEDPGALRLGGERREVTVMFADLSGFTALSGRVSPEELTRLTNRYLGLIVAEVEATGGYVDKFIGDAVMALWGAPVADAHHAAHGVRAALAAVARVEAEYLAAAARGEPGFAVKIGLHSGPAVVGNVGTDRRYNYTAVGETVNVASRLEGVPTLYGCRVVMGAATAERAREAFFLRELDTIRVKGREAPLAVFEPLADLARAGARAREDVKRYADALALYRAGRFADAAGAWETLAREQEAGAGPGPAVRMAERARRLAAAPPPAPWDGVWELTSK